MQEHEIRIYYIYSQSQCKFGKVMFKLTSIFPPLSLSGSSTYSSFTLQEKSKWSERGLHEVKDICTPLQPIHLLSSKKQSICAVYLSVISLLWRPPRPSFISHCETDALPISCQITKLQSLVTTQTGRRHHNGDSSGRDWMSVWHIQTAGYLHFSCNESGQLRQEQEENEDTAEDGNCRQTHTGVSINWLWSWNEAHVWH